MARVDLVYPKISDSSKAPLKRCVAFEKYDGTNLHWAWDRELGWYGFGTRRHRYDLDQVGAAEFHENHPGFDDAIELFHRDLEKPLADVFTALPAYTVPQITVFTEYVGPSSFAGLHHRDDPKRLVLLDVASGDAIVPPEQFVRDFSHLEVARVVYRGKLTGKFANDVREGRYGVTEGVVCKGGDAPGDVWMVKIKTFAYMARLQQAFQDDWEAYWE